MSESINIKTLQLLSSKILHDILQPVNSLKFSIDMMNSDSHIDSEVMNVAKDSIETLTNKLTYYRAALGSTSIGEGKNAVMKIKEHIVSLYQDKDCDIIWSNDIDDYLITVSNTPNLKILLNIYLFLYSIINSKSSIEIFCNHLVVQNKLGIAFLAKGDNLKLGIDNIQALELQIPEENLTPRNIQSYYTSILTRKYSGKLEVQDTLQGEIHIACTLDYHKKQ